MADEDLVFKDPDRERSAAHLYGAVHDTIPEAWDAEPWEEKEKWLCLADAVGDIRKQVWNGCVAHMFNMVAARGAEFMKVADDPFGHEGIRKMAEKRASEWAGLAKEIQACHIKE